MARKPAQEQTYPVSAGRWFQYDPAIHGAQQPEDAVARAEPATADEPNRTADENPQALDLDSKVAGAVHS